MSAYAGMDVSIRREVVVAVAEPSLNVLERIAEVQHDRGAAMPEVVETDVAQVVCHQLLPVPQQLLHHAGDQRQSATAGLGLHLIGDDDGIAILQGVRVDLVVDVDLIVFPVDAVPMHAADLAAPASVARQVLDEVLEEEHRRRLEEYAQEQVRLASEAAKLARQATESAEEAASRADEAIRQVENAIDRANEAYKKAVEAYSEAQSAYLAAISDN